MSETSRMNVDRFFELCTSIFNEYPDAKVVEIALTYEDGSKVTFAHDESIREELEATKARASV